MVAPTNQKFANSSSNYCAIMMSQNFLIYSKIENVKKNRISEARTG